MQSGMGYIDQVLGGKYLAGGNPYVNQMAQQAGQSAGNAVNSTFSLAGRTGGGNHVERLAEGVANAENGVRYQNYMNERGAQGQALNAIPGMVASQYAGVPAYLGAAQAAGTLPYAGIQQLGQMGNLFGGYGTSTGSQTQPGGWGTQLLGAAASALPFII
jgi:hypothetical protein